LARRGLIEIAGVPHELGPQFTQFGGNGSGYDGFHGSEPLLFMGTVLKKPLSEDQKLMRLIAVIGPVQFLALVRTASRSAPVSDGEIDRALDALKRCLALKDPESELSRLTLAVIRALEEGTDLSGFSNFQLERASFGLLPDAGRERQLRAVYAARRDEARKARRKAEIELVRENAHLPVREVERRTGIPKSRVHRIRRKLARLELE
jgi:hypothetical protein